MSTQDYRRSDGFRKNREIWKHKFIDKWSLKDLSVYYSMSPQEIKEVIERQKDYFQQEYA
jgi:hypothetical protein